MKGEASGGKGARAGLDDPTVAASPPRKRTKQKPPRAKRDRRTVSRGGKAKHESDQKTRRIKLPPGLRLAYKALLIGVTSIAFATTTTLLFEQFIIG